MPIEDLAAFKMSLASACSPTISSKPASFSSERVDLSYHQVRLLQGDFLPLSYLNKSCTSGIEIIVLDNIL